MEEKKFAVLEIFRSYQGEGVFLGTACVFVRLAGCNLNCPWCDTKETMMGEAQMVTADDIANSVAVAAKGAKMVVITGGEPTLQDLPLLCQKLHSLGYFISVETNGTNKLEKQIVDYTENNAKPKVITEGPDWITCSPKAPDYKIMCQFDELKYVVDDDFTLDVIDEQVLMSSRIWFQPCDVPGVGSTRSVEKIREIMEENHEKCQTVRIGIQAHKYWNID